MRSASRGCWRRPHRVAKTRGTGWRIAGGIRWRNRVEQGGENPWNPHASVVSLSPSVWPQAQRARIWMVWMGEPSMFHIEMPEAHPQYEDAFMPSHWRRIAIVRPEDLPGLSALDSLIARAGQERGKQDFVAAVSVAMGRFSRTFTTNDWREVVLDLTTALEAALGPAN